MIETLIENGFSEQEARVYLACLELGASPVSRIARRLGEHRVTVYSLLKKMLGLGYVSMTHKGNTSYYIPMDPDKLMSQKQFLFQKLESIVPELKALYHDTPYQVQSKLYAGIDGLKTAFMEVINSYHEMSESEKFLAITGTGTVDPIVCDRLINTFMPYRITIPRGSQVIMGPRQDDYFDYTKQHHECIIIDDPVIDFANELVIYGKDKVALFLYQSDEMAAIIIQSASFHRTLSSLFRLVWKFGHSNKQ